ncbi:MAG: hypothetical protein AB3N63_09335 [Puniceicoccaceae bacterium]
MIVFIIPLKSKAVSKDWPLTSSLLRQTLNSISTQSVSEFRAIVVCHDLPDFEIDGFNFVELIQVDLPVPDNDSASQMRKDKEQKLEIGLNRALEIGCSHMMKLDADDLIHRDLAEYILKSPADVNVVNRGIIWKRGTTWYQADNHTFHRICGSSSIFRSTVFRVKENDSDSDPPGQELFTSDNHEAVYEISEKMGLEVANPPFPAVCYCLSADSRLSEMYHPDHKESLRALIGRLRRMRLLTQQTRTMFALK